MLTSGRGSGDGHGSQGALIHSPNRRWLFAVNAGNNDVSSFRVRDDSLTLVSIIPSGGVRPVRLTMPDNLVYALNTDGAGGISDFTYDNEGELRFLRRSTRPLSGAAAAGPAPGPTSSPQRADSRFQRDPRARHGHIGVEPRLPPRERLAQHGERRGQVALPQLEGAAGEALGRVERGVRGGERVERGPRALPVRVGRAGQPRRA